MELTGFGSTFHASTRRTNSSVQVRSVDRPVFLKGQILPMSGYQVSQPTHFRRFLMSSTPWELNLGTMLIGATGAAYFLSWKNLHRIWEVIQRPVVFIFMGTTRGYSSSWCKDPWFQWRTCKMGWPLFGFYRHDYECFSKYIRWS